ALVRTAGDVETRHAGLSQFLVDLTLPGIAIRPIRNLAGEDHFDEVVFTDAFLADDTLIGEQGGGWTQVTAELALERSGPERYLSSIQLLLALLDEIGPSPDERSAIVVGRLVAHLLTLRQMSLSVAGMLQAGRDPALEASVVKDLGVSFEQELPGAAQALVGA